MSPNGGTIMRDIKRILAALLACVMLVGFLPTNVFAVDSSANDEAAETTAPQQAPVAVVGEVDNSDPNHPSHCVCGGSDAFCAGHSAITGAWTPWDGTTQITQSGNYYLTGDVTNTEQIWIGYYGVENDLIVNLCLNGYSISSENRVLATCQGITLNVMNCRSSGGQLRGSSPDNEFGGVLWIQKDSVANLYGIDLIRNKDTRATTEGGVAFVEGVLSLNSVTVSGGQANIGGGVYVADGASLQVSGDTKITGNTSGETASNVYLSSGCYIDITGKLASTASIGVTMERICGIFTTANAYSTLSNSNAFVQDNTNKTPVSEMSALCFPGYRVGYAAAQINPTPDGSIHGPVMPVGLSGYGNQNTRIATAIDPDLGLIASVLAVTDDDNVTVLVISCDSASVADSIRNEMAGYVSTELGIPKAHIYINSNHQHSTPTGSGTYNSMMARWIADAAKVAMENRAAATIDIASTHVNQDENGYLPGKQQFNFVRNYALYDIAGNLVGMVTDNHSDIGRVSYSSINHESMADDEIQMVRFTRAGESTLLMANFQTHPHMLTSSSSTVVTSDIIGVFRNEMESLLEAQYPGSNYEIMYISGAGGNINATGRSDVGCWSKSSNHATNVTQAKLLPQRAFAHIKDGTAWQPAATGKVRVSASTNYYPVNVNYVYKDWVGKVTLEEVVAAAKQAVANGYNTTYRDNYGIYSRFHAEDIVTRETWTPDMTKDLTIGAISIGDIAFVTVPYEMFDTNGQELKADSPYKMTFVNTLANVATTTKNGHNGYIPSQRGFDNGGYSTDLTKFAPGTGEVIVSDLVSMLYGLKGEDEIPTLVHCICGDPTSTGNPCADGGHALRRWKLWNDTETVPYLTGYWYLGDNLDLAGVAHNYSKADDGKGLITSTGVIGWDSFGNPLTQSVDVYVDLNGKTITGRSEHRIFRMQDSDSAKYTLTLTDAAGGGKIISKSATNSKNQGSIVWMRGIHNTLNVYGGTYNARSTNIAASTEGGAFTLNGTANFYGGTIIGSGGSGNGNALFALSLTKLYIGGKTNISGSGNKSIYLYNNNRATLAGSITLSGMYLCKNVYLDVHALQSGTAIQITAENYGAFTSHPAASLISRFRAGSGGKIQANSNGTLCYTNTSGSGLTTGQHATHCVCGGKNAYCQGHEDIVGDWIPWDGKSAIPLSGNYYLTADITDTTQRWLGTLYGLNGYHINLCLNGHSISSIHRDFGIASNTSVNIMNCKEATSILKGCCSNNDFGGTMLIQTDATVAIYDNISLIREVRSDRVVAYGGAIGSSGKLYLYGTTVTGGPVEVVAGRSASGQGGAIYVSGANSLLHAYGATITGSTCVNGGVIYAGTATDMYLEDTVLQGGVASGLGGGIYSYSTNFSIGGDIKITGNTQGGVENAIYLEDGAVVNVAKPLATTTSLAIAMTTPGIFSKDGGAYANRFTTNLTGYRIASNGPSLELTNAAHVSHCSCGGSNLLAGCDHDASANIWTSWDGQTNITAAGSYYLTKDISHSSQVKIGREDGTPMTVIICTNSYDLRSSSRILTVYSGVTLHICNCNKKIVSYVYGNGINSGDGGVILSLAGSTVNVYDNVIVKRLGTADTVHGGAVYNEGTFNMYNCDISGGKARYGGSVYNNGVFNMYGGTIYNGSSSKAAGNIYNDELGNFTMYAGTIRNGVTSGTHGGNLYNYGEFYMSGGIIRDGKNTGTGDNRGGNIAISSESSHTTITGSAKVLGGEAQSHGANIFLYSGELTVSGDAEITSGTLRSSGFAPCILQNNLVGSTYYGKVHVEGSPKIDEIYVNGGHISVGVLTGDASVGVRGNSAPRQLTETKIPVDSEAYLHCTLADHMLFNSDDGLIMMVYDIIVSVDGAECSFAEALNKVNGTDKYIQLVRDLQDNLVFPGSMSSCYLDLNGYDISGNISIGSGTTLALFDSATSNYTSADRGKITGSVSGTIADTCNTPSTYGHNYRYLVLVEEDGSISAHRFYLAVKSVILSPCKVEGSEISTIVDYKTSFKSNDLVVGQLTGYGVKITGDNTVYTDFVEEGMRIKSGKWSNNLAITMLGGTLKSSNTPEENLANAQAKPAVCAYITLADGSTFTSTTIAYSLLDLIEMTAGEKLNDSQKASLDFMERAFPEVFGN